MPESSDWIYCRLVDRGKFIFPRKPFWIGQVEFSDKDNDDAVCAEALAASMGAFAVSETGKAWERLVRARILVLRRGADEAWKYGAFHLDETLQAFNSHLSIGMSELRATDAGYIYDIRRRTTSPLMPQWTSIETPYASAMLDQYAVHPRHVLNTLLCAPQAFGELGNAFRRSSHWHMLATRAVDEGEALLLYWMAAECLCKVPGDKEIISKLLAACGFPMGNIARTLDRSVARRLSAMPMQRVWRKKLASLFDKLRIARNNIVHEGYRSVDLSSLLTQDQRTLSLLVLPLVTQYLASMALYSLNLGLLTIEDMWQRYQTVLNAPNDVLDHVKWFITRLESKKKAPLP